MNKSICGVNTAYDLKCVAIIFTLITRYDSPSFLLPLFEQCVRVNFYVHFCRYSRYNNDRVAMRFLSLVLSHTIDSLFFLPGYLPLHRHTQLDIVLLCMFWLFWSYLILNFGYFEIWELTSTTTKTRELKCEI